MKNRKLLFNSLQSLLLLVCIASVESTPYSSSKEAHFPGDGTISYIQQYKRHNNGIKGYSLTLQVFLDQMHKAHGDIYWEEGKGFSDTAENHLKAEVMFDEHDLTVAVTHLPSNEDKVQKLNVDNLQIFNFPKDLKPVAAYVNNQRWHTGDWHYNSITKTLEGFDLHIPFDNDFVLQLRAGQDEERLDCLVSWNLRNGNDIPEENCISPCLWDADAQTCSLPPNSEYGYVVNGDVESTETGFRVPLSKLGDSLYGNDIQDIVLEVFTYSDNLLRIKFYDASNTRYEVPLELNLPTSGANNPQYSVEVENGVGSPFSMTVTRQSTGVSVLDTGIGGLTFADQLLHFATRLPSENVYGLGENSHNDFRRQMNRDTWALHARDEPPSAYSTINLYGEFPFYECLENDGNAHGVFILNSNAQEYQLLTPPAFSYTSVGGILDIFVFLGPEPEAVVSQFTDLIGRPHLPPYWGLGFQISRYGYKNTGDMRQVVERTQSCGVPLDVQYADIDYMDRYADFTVDPVNFADLPDYVREQQEQGLNFVFIIDPAIPNREGYQSHQNGVEADVFIRWPEDINNGSILYGNVWPAEDAAFPDFMKTTTTDYWAGELQTLHELLPYNGIWNDMNEPSNFDTGKRNHSRRLVCPYSTWDSPTYQPKAAGNGHLKDKTICMSAVQGENGEYRHYDVHSLYGWGEVQATFRGLEQTLGTRPFILSRSTYVSSGRWTTHWTGDNSASWDHMRPSIVSTLAFNLFGIAMTGADICGFNGDTTEELCERWVELGAFYPFSRNHNALGSIDQDPCAWPDTVGVAAKRALEVRYRILPYLYSLLYQANTEGTTVARPLIHEFPQDRDALTIYEQFLWGPAFLICPVLDQGKTSIDVYFPNDVWYDYYTGAVVEGAPGTVTVDAPLNTIPLFIRGGYILPTQAPGANTKESRQNSFGLIVAVGSEGTAQGQFFWDDGESIGTVENNQYHYATISYNQDSLTMDAVNSYPSVLEGLSLGEIEIYGAPREPTEVWVNADLASDVSYDSTLQKLTISNLNAPMSDALAVNFVY